MFFVHGVEYNFVSFFVVSILRYWLCSSFCLGFYCNHFEKRRHMQIYLRRFGLFINKEFVFLLCPYILVVHVGNLSFRFFFLSISRWLFLFCDHHFSFSPDLFRYLLFCYIDLKNRGSSELVIDLIEIRCQKIWFDLLTNEEWERQRKIKIVYCV